MVDTFEVNGFTIDATKFSPDQFHSGRDGSLIPDSEWDESKRRVENAEMLDTDPDNPLVTWVPIRDWNGDGGELGTNE